MNLKNYQGIIAETAVFPKEIGLLYCGLGLCGEAGEVAEKVKKLYRDSDGVITEEFKQALAKEMGDVIWYLTAMAEIIGISMEEILQINYDKLMARKATSTLHGSGDDREVTNG